jgi:hypothetical protein
MEYANSPLLHFFLSHLAKKFLYESGACHLFHLASDLQLFSAEKWVEFEVGSQSQNQLQNLPR